MEDFDLNEVVYDLNAERSVLGAMMMSPDALAVALENLQAKDFFRPAHQMIFSVIVDLYGRGEPADVVTVAADLTHRGEITRVGGGPYLHEILSGTPAASAVGHYAGIVADRSKVRQVREVALRLGQMTSGADGLDGDAILDKAQAMLFDIAARRKGDDYVHISEVMPGAFDEIDAISNRGDRMAGCPTGFADLDDLTQGLHPGQLVIIAARPAIGKSVLGLDMMRAASIRHGFTSVMFSLEMSRMEIAMRLISAESRVGLHSLRNGTLGPEDWTRIAQHTGAVSEAPMFIDDSPNISITEIRAKARRLKQQHDLRLVVVDYLQLMTSPNKIESRQVEVSEFSRRLKLLAKELQLPVVALSQLNRGPEQRTDKKPMLSDLRESGSIEQDADMVILLHREDAYDKESPRAGEADLIVAKHRNGPTATVTVAFQGHYARFVDMATGY